MQTVYASGGGGGGSRQREVADGADVVFTDTGVGCVGGDFSQTGKIFLIVTAAFHIFFFSIT